MNAQAAVTRFTSKFDVFYQACKAAGIDVSTIDLSTNLAGLPQGILTTRQLKGLALFNDNSRPNAHCATLPRKSAIPGIPLCKLPPLFTDFTYDNLGLPTNWRVVDLSGVSPPDLGLGKFLQLEAQNGKFKVPTLRNVALTPPYGHNGYFATLAGIVHFYNTRDVDAWPDPEVFENMNTTELGDLGLTADEEYSLVVFMQSLTDHQR